MLLDLEQFLDANNINPSEYAITSGYSLYEMGIKDSYNDIDIIVTDRVFDELSSKYGVSPNNECLITIEKKGKPIIDILKDKYLCLGWSNDDVINCYTIIKNGKKIVRPEVTLGLRNFEQPNKRAIKDVKALGTFAIESDYLWDWSLVRDAHVVEQKLDGWKKIKKKLLKYKHKAYLLRKKLLGYFNLRADCIKFHQFVIKKHHAKALKKGTDFYTALPPENVLARQFSNGVFDGCDILIRVAFIRELLSKSSNHMWRDIYYKMQEARGYIDSHNSESFSSLIKSVGEKGMLLNQQISIDNKDMLVDGSHRLACALYFGVPMVGVCRQHNIFKRRGYSLDWFKENGFTSLEVESIETIKNNFLREFGIYFPVIIWPAAINYIDEIENIINADGMEVLSTKEVSFENYDEFLKFMIGIYSSDDIDVWKIHRKADYLKKYELKVKIIYTYIDNPVFRKKADTNNYISTRVERTKRRIREQVKGKLNDYIYDVIVHIGDNYQQNRVMTSVIDGVTQNE